MTTAQNPGYDPDDVLQFAGAAEDRDTTNDLVPFKLYPEEYVYVGVRPKMAVLLELLTVLDDDANQVAQAAAFNEMLDEILDAESVTALRKRLHDRDDDLDLDSPGIEQMFKSLVGLWYGGPTGKAPASRRSPSRTGKRSTVRARSKASTR